MEYLTNPLIDTDADGNLMRHEIVGEILKTAILLNRLSKMDVEKLKIFHANGPYYKGVANFQVETQI